jgi:hypothetical protein
MIKIKRYIVTIAALVLMAGIMFGQTAQNTSNVIVGKPVPHAPKKHHHAKKFPVGAMDNTIIEGGVPYTFSHGCFGCDVPYTYASTPCCEDEGYLHVATLKASPPEVPPMDTTFTMTEDGARVDRISENEHAALEKARKALADVKESIAKAHRVNLGVGICLGSVIQTNPLACDPTPEDHWEIRGWFLLVNVPEERTK